MSAYGSEMERDFSAQSLSNREDSERASNDDIGTGIFMSSFAAMIFIAGLITVGISLLSILIALVVMLRSCESRNSGVLETYRSIYSYDYCKNFALHADLNGLGTELFPVVCKDVNKRYIGEGQYRKDLTMAVGIAEDFFGSVTPWNDGRDVVLMDADDILALETSSTNHMTFWIDKDPKHEDSGDPNYLKHIFSMKLYKKLQRAQWPLVLFSRRPEKMRNATALHLTSMGCHNWSSLLMRMDNEMQMEFRDFLSKQRSSLQREGFHIMAVISSRMDALTGQCLGHRLFKLPNPIIDSYENQMQGIASLQQL